MDWIKWSLVTAENLKAHSICEKINLPREYT